MIFQFFNLLDDLTVLDNILLPAQLAGVPRGKARARADELLAALRIGQHRQAYPARLSGGQRQRVAIARALVNRPAMLLADEPTGALDSANGEEIGELLLDLNRSGQTLVLVTHNPGLAARYATARSSSPTAGSPATPARGRGDEGPAGDPGGVGRGLTRRKVQTVVIGRCCWCHRLGHAGARAAGRLQRAVRARVRRAARRGGDRQHRPGQGHAGQLAATPRLPRVTAAAGPFAEATITPRAPPAIAGLTMPPVTVVGRASPGGPVDELTLTRAAGRGGPARSCSPDAYRVQRGAAPAPGSR